MGSKLFQKRRKSGMRLAKEERLKKGLLFIGEIADLAGVLPSHIAFYTRQGLLKVSTQTRGRFNLYEKEETVRRLSLIKELQDKGVTLEEIKEKIG
ncbi:MerR family transcriptional regulator [Candidatus Omnitrophota bacterium]